MEHKVYWAIKTLNFDPEAAKEKRFLQLYEFDELRFEAYENYHIYEKKTMKWNDNHIMKKRFKESDMVFLFNSRLKLFPKS